MLLHEQEIDCGPSLFKFESLSDEHMKPGWVSFSSATAWFYGENPISIQILWSLMWQYYSEGGIPFPFL